MKDVKTKPKMAKPKMLEKSQTIPREARSILIEQYRARQLTGQNNNESPNEYATDQVESTMQSGANYAGDVVRRNMSSPHRNTRRGDDTVWHDKAQAGGTTGNGERTTSNVAQRYYKLKSIDKNARPKQVGHFSIQLPGSSHMPEQAKKTYHIKKAEDSQIKKQSIRDTVWHSVEKRLIQPDNFSETKPVSFARRSDQAEKNGLAVGEDIPPVKQKKFNVKAKFDILHQGNRTTLQTEKMTAQKAATFTPKTKQAATKIAQTVRKKSQKEAQKQIAKQVVKRGTQTAKATARFAVHVGKTIARTAIALVKGIIALIGGGGVMLVIIIIAVAGALVASPFGVFFSGEDKTENVTPVSKIVQQTNSEFVSAIDKIIEDNDNVDAVKYEYYGCATSNMPNNWPDTIAVFAVKTSMNGQSGMDVVTMDDELAAILKQTFWDMNKIDHHIETIEHKQTVDNSDGTTSAKTTHKHILHIQITGKKANEMADQYGFTQDQRTVMNQMLSSDVRSQINSLLGVS